MKRFILARWRDFTRVFTGWTGVALAALLGAILGVGGFTEAYSQNPKDDSCDGVDCGLEC